MTELDSCRQRESTGLQVQGTLPSLTLRGVGAMPWGMLVVGRSVLVVPAIVAAQSMSALVEATTIS